MRLTQLRQADLNLLVVFAVLAEERSVSRAANRLLLSQPAVSRALQRVRELFRDDLLVRTATRSYELTPQGQRLLQELESIFPRLDRLISGTEFDPASEPTHFRIAVTDYAASLFAPMICRDLVPAARKVTFDLTAWRNDRFEALTQGSLDLVLDADEVKVPSPLQRAQLHEEHFVCVVSASACKGSKLTLKQYVEGDHISVNTLAGSQTLPDDRLAALGHERHVVVRVPYFSTAIQSVPGTALIATVPRRLASAYARDRRIKLLAPPQPLQEFRYMMIWHPRVNTDAAHIWLRNAMQKLSLQLA
jgi:DNA-binding transcriptional LysR family regulator